MRPLAETGNEAIGSMGDGRRLAGLQKVYELAVMGHNYNPLHRQARQGYAEVTNPANDPIREGLYMNTGVTLSRSLPR